MAASLLCSLNVTGRTFSFQQKLANCTYCNRRIILSAINIRKQSTDTQGNVTSDTPENVTSDTPGNIVTKDSKVSADVAGCLEKETKSGHISYRKHPGIIRRSRSQLPSRLLKAIKALLEKYPVKSLSAETEKLTRYLHHRQIPISTEELTKKANAIEKKLIDKEGGIPENIFGLEREEALDERQKKIFTKLRKVVYHWKPMEYDALTSYIYLLGCVATDYAILMQCFTEISKRDPDFRPTSVYNFGSKVGTCVWAADKLWRTVGEYYCVDSCVHMNTIAQLLLQDANEQSRVLSIQGVHFRQFVPSANKNKFSLVVSNFMLMEEPSSLDRLHLVHNLWNMTDTYMVLIENGTSSGFSLIDEARLYLTGLFADPSQESLLGHIFAPCPHNKACPRSLKNQLCLSECIVNEPDFTSSKDQEKPRKLAKYSYLIVKKGPRPKGLSYPRVLQEKKAQKHSHLHLCLPNGELQHAIISKGKFEKHVYGCARHVGPGDFLPVALSDEPLHMPPATDQAIESDTQVDDNSQDIQVEDNQSEEEDHLVLK
ncbi:Methyltransferase-like protein 17, mitochondrial [Bulinus truncatus]|nr:Methyltransferase-like protein 17, mitochondrial [Bulinus truncatus]